MDWEPEETEAEANWELEEEAEGGPRLRLTPALVRLRRGLSARRGRQRQRQIEGPRTRRRKRKIGRMDFGLNFLLRKQLSVGKRPRRPSRASAEEAVKVSGGLLDSTCCGWAPSTPDSRAPTPVGWNRGVFYFTLFRTSLRFRGLRIWWNWQTRYFEVVVGQPVQVQVLLCAPIFLASSHGG